MSDANLLSFDSYKKLFPDLPLADTKMKLQDYNKKQIHCYGVLYLNVINPLTQQYSSNVPWYIVDGDSLLGRDLGLSLNNKVKYEQTFT